MGDERSSEIGMDRLFFCSKLAGFEDGRLCCGLCCSVSGGGY